MYSGMEDALKFGFTLEMEVGEANPLESYDLGIDHETSPGADEVETESPPPKTPKRKSEGDISTLVNKKPKNVLKGMKGVELHAILKKNAVAFCQEVGLMAKSVTCVCGEKMIIHVKGKSKKCHLWVCRKKGHNTSQAMKRGTLFENSKSTFADVLWIMYMWLYKYPVHLMMHECGNSPKVIIAWNKRCLELCQLILEMKNESIGGEGKIVEIFDCKFKEEDSQNWALCALEQCSNKSLLVIVEDTSSDCIRQIFSKYVLPGTTLTGKFWSSLKNLNERDYTYLRSENGITFYHSTIKTSMDTYEEFVKGVNRHQPLTHLIKNEYDPSFFERMYRKTLSNVPDAYIQFLRDVALIHTPLEYYVRLEPKDEKEAHI